ncbi:MAG: thrombospondin type 3 repeat-containing protein [Candidatus Portnoybacteria bacterium]|nr:thrombospondin type 3 repeat-containing protein [Candidatus Portnoybacteria bacterium]
MNQFKRKFYIIAVVLTLLAGISVGGYLVLKSKSSRANFLEQLITQNLSAESMTNDPDHDGLDDWEEKIHKTDPRNPDTDGDGYSDGEEVASGYDPLKKAPDDKLASADKSDSKKMERPDPGNLSQMLTYLIGKQMSNDSFGLPNIQDLALLEKTVEEAADENVAKALRKSSANFLSEFIPSYQKEGFEFQTTKENNLDAIRNYAGRLRDNMSGISPCEKCGITSEDDADIIQKFIETKNSKDINCMADLYLESYEAILNEPVPLDWVDIHKRTLVVFWSMHKIYYYLPEYEKDPLKGILILKKFEETAKNLRSLIEEIVVDLESRQK